MSKIHYEFELAAEPGGSHRAEVLLAEPETGLRRVQITIHARAGIAWQIPKIRVFSDIARVFLDPGAQRIDDAGEHTGDRMVIVYEGAPRILKSSTPWRWANVQRTVVED